MGMRKGKFIYATIYLMVLFALPGCGGRLSVGARDDGKADVSLFMDTGKAASRAIASIMASLYPSGAGGQGAVFTQERADALAKGLSGRDVADVSAEALSPSVLSMKATLLEAALAATGEGADGVLASLVHSEGNSLSISITPEAMLGLYDSMDGDARGYMDLFMAPVFTGEPLTGEEYAALIASVYGKDIAGEISTAVIDFSLSAPKGKKLASCSSADAVRSGRKASFSVPLLKLLTLDEELSFGIGWEG